MRNAPRMKLPMFKDDQRLLRGGVELTYSFDSLSSQMRSIYGTIPLISSYTGPVLRARRADGAVSDFYWLPYYPFLRNTSFVSILTWAGGQNVTVSIWYDQKLNVNAEQTIVGSQPLIVNNGVVALDILGFPAIVFDGSNDQFLMTDPSVLQNVAAGTFGHLVQKANVGTTYLTLFGGGTGQARAATGFNAGSFISYRGLDADVTTTGSTGAVAAGWRRIIGRARYSEAGGDIIVDGALTTVAGGTAANSENTPASNAGRIGSAFSTNYTAGGFSRVVISPQLVDRVNLDNALIG